MEVSERADRHFVMSHEGRALSKDRNCMSVS